MRRAWSATNQKQESAHDRPKPDSGSYVRRAVLTRGVLRTVY